MQPNHAKRVTTDHPAREDAAPTFWQTDTGLMLVIRVPLWDSQAMESECGGITGSDFYFDSFPSRSGGQDVVTYI